MASAKAVFITTSTYFLWLMALSWIASSGRRSPTDLQTVGFVIIATAVWGAVHVGILHSRLSDIKKLIKDR